MIKQYLLWLIKFFTIIILFIVVIPALIAGVSKVMEEGAVGDSSIAVIELVGEIMDTKDVVSELYKQADNHHVDGIVLRIDSPGGAVGPSQDVYSAVKRLKAKKPIVVSMGGVAASGGLYSSLAASKVFAREGTLTGSIGVIMQVPNFTKVTDKIGVDMITVKSGELKDVGNPFRPFTAADRKLLESTIQDTYEQFIKAVSEGRNIPLAKVREFADGRILTGVQAKDLKLIDEFGDVYDAARAVYELKGKPLKDGEVPKLFYPGQKFGPIRELIKNISLLPRLLNRGISINYIMN